LSSLIKDISQNKPFGKALRVYEVPSSMIDTLHSSGVIDTPKEMDIYPNQPLVLKSGQQSVLAVVAKEPSKIIRANTKLKWFGVSGRNKEQILLQNLLDDPEIRCLVITGPAGTGKTTVIGSYSLEQVTGQGGIKKLILSKPLEIVTKSRYWGTVPGDEGDKFGPFLKSYTILFENMAGGQDGSAYIKTMMDKKIIEFMPLELMRGASLRDCVCWYDEAQNLNHFEMLTLGSRLDDTGGSKLVLSGDLGQRDRNIQRNRTGIHKLVTSPHFLNSPYTAHIDLVKNERGKISQLFYDVFDDDPNKD